MTHTYSRAGRLVLFVAYGAMLLGVIAVSEPNPETVPIVFFGDSLTEGQAASSPERGFAQILRGRMEERGYGEGYRLALSALEGLFGDLAVSQTVGATPRQMIVVEVGVHSAIRDTDIPGDAFAVGYGVMLDCLVGTGANIVVGTVPWLGWDATHPFYQRAEEFSGHIRSEARKRGLPLADVWEATRDRDDLLGSDGIHPNDEGHRILADLYWEQIEPLLEQRPGEFSYRCDYNRLLREAAR